MRQCHKYHGQVFSRNSGIYSGKNILYQDNKSATIREMNGKNANSKGTKHIKIQYFFVTDRIEQKELELEYCPTDILWSCILTKPLQDLKLKQMRANLMNCPTDYQEPLTHPAFMMGTLVFITGACWNILYITKTSLI